MTSTDVLDRVLVIIPTYNESQNIESVANRLRKAVPHAHILIADDNSPDGTGAIADRLAEADSQIHVMHRAGKQGLGAAYLAGFEWGMQHGYGVLVSHDADGSHQPEELPRLLQAINDGADMVKGSRWVKGGSIVNWPASRVLISKAGSLWTRLWLGIPVKDATGGFNAYRATTLQGMNLNEVASAGYCFQIDLVWRAIKHGFKVVEVPIEFVEREFGDSKMNRNIVIEALIRTTLWGIEHRLRQIGRVVRGLIGRARPGVR
ncbi:MAG: polyprenol monophosphomannose synthase [Propionibacteriaceae bacterium]|nr:polyprenol monophosphomannose synthase [Propionibacteriaceae bacterium]